jgi:hypothetical protein
MVNFVFGGRRCMVVFKLKFFIFREGFLKGYFGRVLPHFVGPGSRGLVANIEGGVLFGPADAVCPIETL